MVNFYIVNVLGQNFANSESCPILRLLKDAFQIYYAKDLLRRRIRKIDIFNKFFLLFLQRRRLEKLYTAASKDLK